MTATFEWNDGYAIGVKEIDLQHKKFVLIIEVLNDAIRSNLPEDKMQEVLNDLEQYMKYHFSTEEGYFEEFKYEGAKEHINEHKMFVEKIAKFKADYANHKTEVSFELIDFLEDWLIDHMNSVDKKYIDCFVKNGLK